MLGLWRFCRLSGWGALLALWPLLVTATDYETGDLIFQQSRSAQSLAIQEATRSRYSHMGMIVLRDGEAFVLEAADKVRYRPLAQWIARGENGHYVVKRLREEMALDAAAQRQLVAAADGFLGKPYDLLFAWSDEAIYCSELVWKSYQRSLKIEIGALQRLREFDLQSPVVQAKMRERYGEHIPLDERVISPGAMFDSEYLVVVEEAGM